MTDSHITDDGSELKLCRYVGSHPGELEGGRPLSPGEYVGLVPIVGHNLVMFAEGDLVEVRPEDVPEEPKDAEEQIEIPLDDPAENAPVPDPAPVVQKNQRTKNSGSGNRRGSASNSNQSQSSDSDASKEA